MGKHLGQQQVGDFVSRLDFQMSLHDYRVRACVPTYYVEGTHRQWEQLQNTQTFSLKEHV
jgi:hypothetical protein